MTEVWRVVDFDPRYEVSSEGRVWNGTRLLAGSFDGRYQRFALGRGNNWRVHRLMAHVFFGPAGDGQVVRHLDDDPLNNSLPNLAYGTQADNMADASRNGRLGVTHCKRGHELTQENTSVTSGARRCRTCKNVAEARYRRQRGIPERVKRRACTKGHEYTDESTRKWVDKRGLEHQICRTCEHAKYLARRTA